jgi:hypothetical protein
LTQKLTDLFSKPPASFAWATNEQGRTIGTSEGFLLDIWPDRVEAAAIFPPDRPDLVERNATLMQLLLLAMRPDWNSASNWLALQMRRAARTEKPFDEVNVTRRTTFAWSRAHSRATLKVLL